MWFACCAFSSRRSCSFMFRMFKAAVITKSGMTRPFLSKYRAQRTAHCAVPAQHTDTSPGVRCCVLWATAAPRRAGALRGAGGHQPAALRNGPSMGPSSCCVLPLSAKWYAARGYGTGLASPGDPRGFKVALRFDPAPLPHTQGADAGTSLDFKQKYSRNGFC